MIQIIVQIVAQALFSWRRGAKGDAQTARCGKVDVVYVHDIARLSSKLPVAIYCRDSAHRPEESTLDAQVAACVERAEADGERVDPVYIYRERGSGRSLDRALLGRLREGVKAGEVGVVYVGSPDRLSRNVRHLALLEEEFASAGVEIRIAKYPVAKVPCGRRFAGAAPGACGDAHDQV